MQYAMAEPGYVTKQDYVKVGENTILVMYVHILPNCSEGRTQSPFAWWSDRITQELLAFVHKILMERSTANIRETFEDIPKVKSKRDDVMDKFYFRKSPNFRGMFIFQSYTSRTLALLPTKSYSGKSDPACAAYTNEYGKRVLPVLVSPSSGSDFGSSKILPHCLHAYIDSWEPFSCLGIFRVLKFLAPKHEISLDVASYFRPSDRPEDIEQDNLFPEIPLAGLQSRRPKKKSNSSKITKQKSHKLNNKKIPTNQPLIDKALQSTTTTDDVYTEANLPPDVLDELFDFSSQPTHNSPPPLTDNLHELSPPPTISSQQHESTPPLIEQRNESTCSKITNQSRGKPLQDLTANNVIKDPSVPESVTGVKESNSQSNSSQSSRLFDSLFEPDYIPTDEICLLATPTTPRPVIAASVVQDAVVGSRESSTETSVSISMATSSECVSTADIEGVCVVMSSDEEVLVTKIQEGRKKRRAKSILSLEQIMDGVSGLRDLTNKKIIQWLRLRTPVIVDIFKGKLFSQRHNDYMEGAKKKALLKYAVDTSMFDSDQLDTLHKNVLNLFCSKSMKYFDYVMSVLVPECVVRLIADVSKVSFTEAERMMYSYQSVDLR